MVLLFPSSTRQDLVILDSHFSLSLFLIGQQEVILKKGNKNGRRKRRENIKSLLQTKFCSDTLQREKHGLSLAGREIFEGDEIRQGRLDLQGRGDVDAAVFGGGAVADDRGWDGSDVAVAVDVAEGIGQQAEEVGYGIVDDGCVDPDEGGDVEGIVVVDVVAGGGGRMRRRRRRRRR